MELRTEVLIIGGGATGAGIARDLALRGIPCLLLEKGDFASGASGRNHGLLHSGGRYVVSDPEAARECIQENRILKRIAPHCLEETGGLFVSLPEDGLDFQDRFLSACQQAGIEAARLSRDEALGSEPSLNPDLLGAVRVPDGSIDPFTLILENIRDAETHGARFLPHTAVTSFVTHGNRIEKALVKETTSGEEHFIYPSYVINATGAWVNTILGLANLRLEMALSKGSMLITNQRLSQRVINRCRKPSDGDIVVPNDTVSILGTTSVHIDQVENFEVTPAEVSLLIQETRRMIPDIGKTRFIRAYAGIRPLVQSSGKGDDRAISRGFTLIDHGEKDGLLNLITITGGKFVTYRLMAERTVDLICNKMGVEAPCSSHLKPLPGVHEPKGSRERFRKFFQDRGEILCDCEMVQRKEIDNFLSEGKMKDLQDILHRTRLAKGTCQGGFCVFRLLGVLHELGKAKGDSNDTLKKFLEERWRGRRPILWGTSIREEELLESIYKGMFDLES
jgi:glycerol-3-phosphate dehydrogenase